MLDYDYPLYRPPSEGDHLIIQATLGCSFNKCTFCSMYQTKKYHERTLEEVFTDIEAGAREWPTAHRAFLADGDAYGLPTEHLVKILDKLAEHLPNLQRVAAYASPFNLLRKSVEEIQLLRSKKLTQVYFGIESGSDWVLKRISKGSSRQMEQGLSRAREADLRVSAMVITGLAGKNHWEEHMDGTAALINKAPPNFLSTVQLDLVPIVQERFYERFGEPFVWQDEHGVLLELQRLIQGIETKEPIIFRSNHASNALPLAGTLPKDKDRLLAQIEMALEEGVGVRRHRWRRLS